MATKKGVSTKIVLSLGLVILVAIVLLIGVNIIAPLFKDTPAYVAVETALSINSIYAAPEDVKFEFDFPSQAETCKFEITGEEVKISNCKKPTIAPKTYAEDVFVSEIKDLSKDNVKKIRLEKEYNEDNAKNKKLKIGVLTDLWHFF